MKKLCFLLTALCLVSLSAACDDEDDTDLGETLVGRLWAGDLGFYDGRIPLDSFIYFGGDGFGSDELRYADNGEFLDRLNIRWWIERRDCLCIDYGALAPLRELCNARVSHGRLSGDLYIDGIYYDHVTLYMQ